MITYIAGGHTMAYMHVLQCRFTCTILWYTKVVLLHDTIDTMSVFHAELYMYAKQNPQEM